MIYWSSLILGLLGSLHCAGMCGPLVLAREARAVNHSPLAGRLFYNLGRTVTYAGLGAIFGGLGQSFSLLGFQQGISIVAGIAVIVVFMFSTRLMLLTKVAAAVHFLKQRLGGLLTRPGNQTAFALGIVNGLLPCGLVYTACAGAASTANVASGTGSMVLFGLGTIPMMLTIALAGSRIQFQLRARFQKLIPVCVVLVAVLLIVRGLGLGIPYLSPGSVSSCCPAH